MRLKVILVPMLLVSAAQLPSQPPDFVKQVQPIFVGECSGCHRGATAPAGLQLDSVAGMMKVIVPGNPRTAC